MCRAQSHIYRGYLSCEEYGRIACTGQLIWKKWLDLPLVREENWKIVEDNDAENTKRSTKVARQVFQEYLEDKKITEPEEKTKLALYWGIVSFSTV